MDAIVSPTNYVTRQNEACNLLANLAYSISGKMPATKNFDYTQLVPYLVNASARWAQSFVGLDIPIPNNFSSFKFLKTQNGQLILSQQAETWSLSLMEDSLQAMDFMGNMTSKCAEEQAFCTAVNGSVSHLMPGDTLARGALHTQLTREGDLIINEVVVYMARGNKQAATSARYDAIREASRLVGKSKLTSSATPSVQLLQQEIYSCYVKLEIIKQYCASLWLLQDARSLAFAQSALEAVLACIAERLSPGE
ncbi:hypothetical protein BH10CYA1_BH10CYA1_18380 [soil metagenome]